MRMTIRNLWDRSKYGTTLVKSGGVNHALRAAAILPTTRSSPGRSADRAGRAGFGAARPGPARRGQDQGRGQVAARTAPLGPAAPEPAVPALGRVLEGQSRSPLILAQ